MKRTPRRPPAGGVRIALVAYQDDGAVLQLVPLGTVAKPLPIAALIEQVRERVSGASIGHVLRFHSAKEEAHDER